MTADTESGSLISERVAGGILPRVLTTFDMAAIFVAIVLGATISYGTWFWWIAGITVASLAVAALLYLVGRASAAAPVPVAAGGGRSETPGADG